MQNKALYNQDRAQLERPGDFKMKKIHPLLDIILLQRYVQAQLMEQTLQLPKIPSVRPPLPRPSYEPWIGKPTAESPKVKPTRSTQFEIPPLSSTSQAPKISLPDAESIIASEIESAWSLTKDLKTIVKNVRQKQGDLYGFYPELESFTVQKLKEKTGQTEPAVATEVVPDPYTPPALPQREPDIDEPPVLEIQPKPEEVTSISKSAYPELQLSPELATVLAAAISAKAGTDLQQGYESQAKMKRDEMTKRYTMQGEMPPQKASDFNIPDFDYEGGPDKIKYREDGMEGSDASLDADLMLDKILGKYSSTLRLK